jgi:hypothetical protein
MRHEKQSCFFERSFAGSSITRAFGLAAESTTCGLRKFVRRHRELVIVIMALGLGLAIGLAVTLAMYISFQGTLDKIF